MQLKNIKKNMNKNNHIGVFDSGLGGLTVLKSLKFFLPEEKFIYYGDTANIPYGNKSRQTIEGYCLKIVDFLQNKKVKMIVVACNSASSVALDIIERHATVPIIDVISPTVNKINKEKNLNTIGVIGTNTTISSEAYQNQIIRLNKNINVITQPCPLFVPIIESGFYNNEIADQAISLHLKKLKKYEIDALILGCTHYPILNKKIQSFLKCKIVDSPSATSLKVEEYLDKNHLRIIDNRQLNDEYYVSDKINEFNKMARLFLEQKIDQALQVKL